MPNRCPSWCQSEHDDDKDATEGQHMALGGSGFLDELRNFVDGRVSRPGGGGWDLAVLREDMPAGSGGFWGPALIELETRDLGDRSQVRLHLLSGEARVLARQLVALADRIDLAGTP